LLLAAIVGSGIMGERLAGGNAALALLANTIATGAALVALILTFGPISGAHFNPAVTLADATQGGLPWREVPAYVVAQIGGAFVGVATAHLMFAEALFTASQHGRHGLPQAFSEFVATFGLLSVIWGCSRVHSTAVAFAVGAYITAAYWFTASTSFANPAVTLARAATDTFAGIRPDDVPAFISAQFAGAGLATVLFRWLVPTLPSRARAVVVPTFPADGGDQEAEVLEHVLFACTHNAGRSQMAAAFFNALADSEKARAESAGTQPGERVHPEVVTAMQEVGLDLANARPRRLTPDVAATARYLITMGCREECPFVPDARLEDWPIDDPKGQSLEQVRAIRDEVRRRVEKLIAANGWRP
jgi:glycerol uptake facilitator-like aquaporin/protein-tyrosine-phosphatase